MKKLLLAAFVAFFPSLAWAQCTGIFPANTFCGNNTGTPTLPFPVPASTGITGPGTTVVGDLATWNNTSGTNLADTAPGALTSTNDTNVTITLGGTPASSLVKAVSLTMGWTSQLSVARGGTGIASGTSGGIPYFSSATTIASSGLLNSLILGNGAGAAPTNYTGTACTGTFVRSLSNLGVATCQQISLTADVSGILPIANGGTNASSQSAAAINLLPVPVNPGDIIYWNGTIWTTLAGNTSGTQVLQENSSGLPSWVTVSGTGTVTAITQGAGLTFSVTPCTSSCTITNAQLEPPQGRITLTANTPVMIASATAATTLRYDCYIGSRVPYFDGTTDQTDTIASCEVTDAMISAASAGQVLSGNVYDVWWVHSGANRICLAMSSSSGGAGGWASDTGGSNITRGTGYSQLDRSTRPYTTNKNAIANCFNGATNYGSVAVNQGTYLGTVYASANGQVSYTFGGSASGGSAGLLGVWNFYNRVTTVSTVTDSGASYTYTSATIRQARASTGNQTQFVIGVAEDSISTFSATRPVGANTSAAMISGPGLDSTTTYLGQRALSSTSGGTAVSTITTSPIAPPQIGFHTISLNENSDGTNANTFNSDSTAILSVTIRN